MNCIKEALINVANFDLRATMSRRSYAFMIFVFPILAFGLFYCLIEFSRFVRLVLANNVDFTFIKNDFMSYSQIVFQGLYANFYLTIDFILILSTLQRLNSITKNKIIKTMIVIIAFYLIDYYLVCFHWLRVYLEDNFMLSINYKAIGFIIFFILALILSMIKERHFNEITPKRSLAYFLTLDFSSIASKTNLIIPFSFYLGITIVLTIFIVGIVFIMALTELSIIIMPIIYIDIFYLLNHYKSNIRAITKIITLISFIAFYIQIICFDRSGIFYEYMNRLFLFSFILVYILAMRKIKNLK